jgi:choline dehydrogenase-like flavoprotein
VTTEQPLPPQPFYTALVVGSGFGASVTALRLAQAFAGTSDTVCVLERGRRYEPADFPRFKLPGYVTSDPRLQTSRRVPDGSRHLWGIDQGLFDVRTLGRLQVVQAAGLGGGSLIYASVHLRPPHEMFASWPAPYNDNQAMDRAYAKVHDVIRPSPVPDHLAAQLPKTRLMREAARDLGLVDMRPPLTIDFGPAFGAQPNTCNACGQCTIGCQEGAKRTLDRNYLAQAIAAGARVQTLCEVTRIARCDGTAQCFYSDRAERCSAPPPVANGASVAEHYRVEYFDHLEHIARHVCAQNVFLGAGAVGTTELLIRSRSGLQRDGAPPLAHLGENFYANGDSLAVVFDTREPAAPSHGPTITTSFAFADSGPKKDWFLLQDGGISGELAGVLGLFRSPLWFGRNRWTRAEQRDKRWSEQVRSAGDRLLMDLQVSIGDRLSGTSKPPPGHGLRLTQLSRAWLELLPSALRSNAARCINLSDMLRSELRKLDRHVLDKLGSETFFLSRWVDQDNLIERVADATAELYPPLRRLLRKESGVAAMFDLLKALLFAGHPIEHALVLLAMGPDQRGTLTLREGKLRVDWQEDANVELYTRQEQLMRDFAVRLGGELRTNPSWTLGRRPVSVHMQGGCSMMDRAADGGVTEPDGQVRGLPGLYVVDAAAFPASVGANPSATIAAVAELKAELFLNQRAELAKDAHVPSPIVLPARSRLRAQPLCLTWNERMTGFWTQHAVAPPPARHTDAELYLQCEQALDDTRTPLSLELTIVIPEPERLLRSFWHPRAAQTVEGTLEGVLIAGKSRESCTGDVSFQFDPDPTGAELDVDALARELNVEPASMRAALTKYTQRPSLARRRLIGLGYDIKTDRRKIIGRKFFHDDPGHDVWPDLTTMYVHGSCEGEPNRVGIVRIGMSDFLRHQLPSYDCFVEGEGKRDPRRGSITSAEAMSYAPDEAVRAWLLMRFGTAFFTSIRDVYERWY